jgi:hypothetical protein
MEIAQLVKLRPRCFFVPEWNAESFAAKKSRLSFLLQTEDFQILGNLARAFNALQYALQ